MLISEELVNRLSIWNTAVKFQFLNRSGVSCSSHIIFQQRAEKKASAFLSLHFFLVMLLSRKMSEDREPEMDLLPEMQAHLLAFQSSFERLWVNCLVSYIYGKKTGLVNIQMASRGNGYARSIGGNLLRKQRIRVVRK